MITPDKIQKIQNKIRKALSEIGSEENVKITFGTSRYDASFYTNTMRVTSTEESKEVVKAQESTCIRLGLPANVIGMLFSHNHGQYKVVDIKTRNRKYPVIVENLKTNKRYKYPVTTINRLLGEKGPKRRSKLRDILDDYDKK